MYCLATCVHDHMLSHVQDAKMPKEAWENLKKNFATYTTTRKPQLRQDLKNIRQKYMSVTDYTAKIKSICNSLGSININVNEDKIVQVCLGGLAQRFDPLRTTILARENPPSFFNLQSMLSVEETHGQARHRKGKCSSRIRMVVGGKVGAVEEVDSTHLTKECHKHDNNHVKIRTCDLLCYNRVLCVNQHVQYTVICIIVLCSF